MSATIQRADWTWLSLFGPKNTGGAPSIEGNFEEEYEVDEEYIEVEIIETEEEDTDMDEETEGMLVSYDDDEED